MRIKVNKFLNLGYLSLLILVIFGFITILTSCGDDDDGGNNIVNNTPQETGVSLANLAGTWYGTLEEIYTGDLSEVQVTIDGSGNITQVLQDGTDIGVTATVTKEDDQIFSFEDNEGEYGGFFVDAAAQHAAFLSEEDPVFIVLQKGASSLPTYEEDLVGSWSGFGVAIDYDFEIVESWNSSATVESDGSFTGSNTLGEAFDGSFSSYNSYYGVYYGDYESDDGSYGDIEALLSVDKTFVATYAVDDSEGGSFPEDYSFEFWSKQ